MSIITTEVKALTPEEEAMIAALSNKLATSKPRPPTDEKKLTTDQIVQIKRACVMGHSAKQSPVRSMSRLRMHSR